MTRIKMLCTKCNFSLRPCQIAHFFISFFFLWLHYKSRQHWTVYSSKLTLPQATFSSSALKHWRSSDPPNGMLADAIALVDWSRQTIVYLNTGWPAALSFAPPHPSLTGEISSFSGGVSSHRSNDSWFSLRPVTTALSLVFYPFPCLCRRFPPTFV